MQRDRRQPREDRDLLVAARTDPEAFARFYDRHNAGLIRHFRRRGLTPDLALDLAAETFATALESLDRYKPARGSTGSRTTSSATALVAARSTTAPAASSACRG